MGTVAATVVLIRGWGPLGAAAAFTATAASGVGVTAFAVYRRFHAFPLPVATVLRVVAATIIAFWAGEAIDSVGIWVVVELGALTGVYLLVLAALRELRLED